MPSGEGTESGVNLSVWMDANCVRRVEISDDVKPAWSRRSNPLGRGRVRPAGLVGGSGPASCGGLAAEASSAASSWAASSSLMEQLTYTLAGAPSTALPLALALVLDDDAGCGGGGGGDLRTELSADESGRRRPW